MNNSIIYDSGYISLVIQAITGYFRWNWYFHTIITKRQNINPYSYYRNNCTSH